MSEESSQRIKRYLFDALAEVTLLSLAATVAFGVIIEDWLVPLGIAFLWIVGTLVYGANLRHEVNPYV